MIGEMHRKALALGFAAAFGFAVEPSVADEATGGSSWRFTASPYFWAAGISGRSGTLPPLPPAEVDLTFSDILEDLRFGGMLAGTATKGRFGISADIQYVETEAGGDLQPFFANARLDSKTVMATLSGEYAVLDRPGASLRLGAGVRLWSVDTELKLSGGPAPDRRIDGDDTWIDPILTARGEADLSERWYVAGWAAVGGFGVGSETMADVFGGVGYRITETTSISAGYRWMKVDREDGDFLYDIEQQGPLVGMTFRF